MAPNIRDPSEDPAPLIRTIRALAHDPERSMAFWDLVEELRANPLTDQEVAAARAIVLRGDYSDRQAIALVLAARSTPPPGAA